MNSQIENLKVFDLFSGIGGFSLGLERTGGFETVAFCEIEEFPRKVLAKHWPNVPIHEDVKTLKGNEYGPIDLVCGGYPCQPFSHAGKRQGTEDDRHLWPEVIRIVATIRPRWCLFENVAGHITMGLDQVLSDLEGEGYTAWPLVIPACAVDAHHRRDRVWIVAHSGSQREKRLSEDDKNKGRRTESGAEFSGGGEDVADADDPGSQGRNGQILRQRTDEQSAGSGSTSTSDDSGQWLPEPDVGRVAARIPRGLDDIGGWTIDEYTTALANAKGVTKGYAIIGVLRTMRQYGEASEASFRLQQARTGECLVRSVSQQVASGRKAGNPYEELRGLWAKVSPVPLKKTQDMFQEMLVRDWKAQCDEALGGRVNRLKALGNAVVPQIVEMIGRAILAAEGRC